MVERRTHERRRMAVEVTLYSDDNFYTGLSGDIGEGGLFIATFSPPPLGTTIDLDVTLPSGYRVAARGQVRWVRSLDAAGEGAWPGCGVRFVELHPEAVREIGLFVRQRDSLYFDDEEVAA